MFKKKGAFVYLILKIESLKSLADILERSFDVQCLVNVIFMFHAPFIILAHSFQNYG